MFEVVEVIQELWSGYGHIMRLRLDGDYNVVVKHIRMTSTDSHPRGWNSKHDLSLAPAASLCGRPGASPRERNSTYDFCIAPCGFVSRSKPSRETIKL